MTAIIFDINDSELRLFRDTELLASQSGYALIKGDELEFGEAARSQIRRHPRQANVHHWHRLNMDPLANPGPRIRNQADLVYRQMLQLAQLAAIAAEDAVVIAASTSTSADQLGLLLGIAEEAGIHIKGIVDAQLAAASAYGSRHRLRHRCQVLDLSLFAATATTLVQNTVLQSSGCKTVAELGLSPLLDSWVSNIADRFLTETRFDPLRIADTEQQVFDQLYQWLFNPQRHDEWLIEVSYQGVERQIEISASQLGEKALRRYVLFANKLEPEISLLLSHRMAALPGFVDALQQAGHATAILTELDLAQGSIQHLEEIVVPGESLRFITRFQTKDLPGDVHCETSAAQTSQTDYTARDHDTAVTHLLFDGHAIPIAKQLTLSRESFPAAVQPGLNGLSAGLLRLERRPQGVFAATDSDLTHIKRNGRPLAAQMPLQPGDVLSIDGYQFNLIRVEDGT